MKRDKLMMNGRPAGVPRQSPINTNPKASGPGIESRASPAIAGSGFGGRTVLRVQEVARRLDVTEQHVINLIDEGVLPAINVNIRGRSLWRIPVEGFEGFLRRRSA